MVLTLDMDSYNTELSISIVLTLDIKGYKYKIYIGIDGSNFQCQRLKKLNY